MQISSDGLRCRETPIKHIGLGRYRVSRQAARLGQAAFSRYPATASLFI